VSDGQRRFALFLLAGGTSAVFNVVSRVIFSQAVRYEIAVVLAYLVGMTIAYTLNKLFVFERSGRAVADEYVRFGIVNLVALAQVWVVSVGLARFLFPALGFAWHADTVAHVIGVAVPAVTSYFGHKHFSFAKSP
jgi:putative flippase GtrA